MKHVGGGPAGERVGGGRGVAKKGGSLCGLSPQGGEEETFVGFVLEFAVVYAAGFMFG